MRDHVLVGKERHDVGRPNDWGYPIRGIVKEGLLYLHNFETSRWPAGNPETGYLNCDGGPSKTEVLNLRRQEGQNIYWSLCFGKRPAEELFDIRRDPECLVNLAPRPDFQRLKDSLKSQLFAELKAQDDPRMFGQGQIFEQYPYANAGQRGFYERFMRGERAQAGWVSASDFEKTPLEEPAPPR